MSTLADLIQQLQLLPQDMAAQFVTYAGPTDVTGAELANWAMRRHYWADAPASPLLVVLPEGMVSYQRGEEEIHALEATLADLQASYSLPRGPGAIESRPTLRSRWEIGAEAEEVDG